VSTPMMYSSRAAIRIGFDKSSQAEIWKGRREVKLDGRFAG